ANPLIRPPPHTDPRGLTTRSLPGVFAPPTKTKRQAAGGAVNNANRTVTLIVIKGDTLGQIATLLNSGICDIAKLNKIANPDAIDVGQVLQVPINVAAPDNDSCLKRGSATAPPAAGGSAKPPAGSKPGGGEKKDKDKKNPEDRYDKKEKKEKKGPKEEPKEEN
ncbi:Intracellular hyphae protein 1, partial [Colletotrichum tanaceti]